MPCDDDEPCGAYSANAVCVAPAVERHCEPGGRSCDVPCSHDETCKPLGNDYKCLVGHCRPQPPSSLDDDGGTSGALPVCEATAPLVGLCVLAPSDEEQLHNDSPALDGTVTTIDAPAQPECFGHANQGASIPNAARMGEEPAVPVGTSWWQVEAKGVTYTVGVAAPGFEGAGVQPGDRITISNAVSWAGRDWASGHAEVRIEDRVYLLIAINQSSKLPVSDGPSVCEVPGLCGGEQWSMLIDVQGQQVIVPPFQSVVMGNATFTNSGALTHRPEYKEADESGPGTPGCREEPRTNFVAARVERL